MMVSEQELALQVKNLLEMVELQDSDHHRHIQYLHKVINSQRRLIEKMRTDFKLIQVVVGEGIAPPAGNELN